MKLFILNFLIIFFVQSPLFSETFDDISRKSKINFFKPVINKLLENGVDSSFIHRSLGFQETKFNKKFVKINVIGTSKKADYSVNYNDRSVKKSKEFLSRNLDILSKAELKYTVPKEVITSILWVETRHGGYLGSNHILSVYYSTAMAAQPKYIKQNKKNLKKKFKGHSKKLRDLEKKLVKRSNKKANWALEQLVALSKMENNSPIPINDLRGSWAGAFGMSQFLPASYIRWAVDGDSDGKINLFEKHDAIFSVANYLKTNGWGETKEAQKKAVYHYNHSNAYVNAVLKLADKIKVIDKKVKPLKKTAEPKIKPL